MHNKRPLRDDIFKETDSGLSLVGSRCAGCGKVFFPKTDLCTRCWGREMIEVELSKTGTLYSYTTTYRPVSRFEPPHSTGMIDTPDGLRIVAPLVGNQDVFRVGMEMELVIDTLWVEDETDIIGYRFRPALLSGNGGE